MLLPSGNPFKCHEEVLYFQLLIPPKRFDIFSPRLGDAQKAGSSEVPRNPLTRCDVSSTPANGIFLTKKNKNKKQGVEND